MSCINAVPGKKFIVIVDEWDVLIRDEAANHAVQEEYINFLRGMFKGSEPTKYLHLAYNQANQTVSIPNEEIRQEFMAAMKRNRWSELIKGSQKYYFKPVREMPAGRGFADFVYIPKTEYREEYPALVAELKWNKNAEAAIRQIKEIYTGFGRLYRRYSFSWNSL